MLGPNQSGRGRCRALPHLQEARALATAQPAPRASSHVLPRHAGSPAVVQESNPITPNHKPQTPSPRTLYPSQLPQPRHPPKQPAHKACQDPAQSCAAHVQASGLQGVPKTTHPFVRVHVGSQAQLTSVKWSTLGPSWEGEPLTFK